MSLRQAAAKALEAIESGESFDHLDEVIAPLLRAALAEPQTTHWEGCEAVHPECKEKVMDRELIIRLAREAGAVFPADGSWHKFEIEGSLERFAELVAAHEREECAKVCEDEGERIDASWMSCAAAIRSRT